MRTLFLSRFLALSGGLHGQAADSAPCGGKDGIGDGRRNRWQSRLPWSGGGVCAGDKIDFDAGHFIHSEQGIVVEVLLLNLPVCYGDLPVDGERDVGPVRSLEHISRAQRIYVAPGRFFTGASICPLVMSITQIRPCPAFNKWVWPPSCCTSPRTRPRHCVNLAARSNARGVWKK